MDQPERRKRTERRLIDIGPPNGLAERRVNPDRRKPLLEEKELTDEEWARYFANSSPDTENT